MNHFNRIPKMIFILIILCTLGSHVQPGLAHTPELTPRQTHTFEDYGYGDRTTYGMFGALEYYFPVPENLVLLDGSKLDLVLSYSPILKSNRSTMTIIINGVAVHSTQLVETTQKYTTISVDLPTYMFQDDVDRAEGLVIQVKFFMRITDLVCEETNHPAQWATIHRESSLTINAQKRRVPNDLALLPYPFIVQNDPEEGGVTFSFSSLPTSEELNTAFQVSRYLGEGLSQGLLNMVVNQDGGISPDEPSIAIGFSPDGTLTSSPAKIALLPVENQAILSISGESPLLAAEILRHRDFKDQLAGQSVEVFDDGLPISEDVGWPWKSGAATFSQLGVSDQIVRGVGQQSLFLFFRRPPGWQLEIDQIYLGLNITPSPMLLSNQSGVRIKINGIDVGAISIDDKRDDGDFYRVNLPADLMNVTPDIRYTDELNLELIFTHQLDQTACEPINAENAWTIVHANSFFYFPHSKHDLPDLSLFPYPFLNTGRDEPILFVLPSRPTNDEIAATLIIGQILGKYSFNPHTEVHVVYSGDIQEISSNAILVGTPERNRWVRAAESILEKPQQGLVHPAVARDAIGNLKQLASPWSAGNWVLIVSGEQDLPAIAKSLDVKLPSASIIAVRENQTIEPVFRDVRGPRIPEPYRQVRPRLIPKPPTWQIVAGVFLVTALVIVIIIFLYRRKSR